MKYFVFAFIVSTTLVANNAQRTYTETDRIVDKYLSITNIYATWRDKYVTDNIDKKDPAVKKECPFCLMRDANEDSKYLVLYRGMYHMIVLNFQPYTRGHLLVVPYEHESEFQGMSQKAYLEMMNLTIQALEIIKKEFDYQGFNIGFNIGAISGASVPDHLHMQVVPRKALEASFLHTIANSRMTYFDLNEEYKRLLPQFQEIGNKTSS